MDSTFRTLAALSFGPMAETGCARDETDIATPLTENVVLELDALTNADKTFLVEALLLHIHHLRLAEPERERLKHVLIVEEAHHVFLKRQYTGGRGDHRRRAAGDPRA